jgi:hypothetical protein
MLWKTLWENCGRKCGKSGKCFDSNDIHAPTNLAHVTRHLTDENLSPEKNLFVVKNFVVLQNFES